MAKYRFAKHETFAVWQHYGKQCYWCGEPLRLQEATVDHVIPEHLLEKPDKLAQVLLLYGLDAKFDLNDFCNWVPCHERCNKSKGGKSLPAVPMICALLEKLVREAGDVRKISERVRRDTVKDRLLGQVSVALEQETITPADILALFSGLEDSVDEDVTSLKNEVFTHFDPSRWTIVEISGNIATVTDGHFGGMVPVVKVPDESWRCPHCSHYGPWNGTRCLTCGQMSDPSD